MTNSISLSKFFPLDDPKSIALCSLRADCSILLAGYYLLANTRLTSQPGYIGRLYGPSLPGNLQYCLRFYYAIYGFLKMSDTLAVYIFEENHVVQEKVWSVLESPRGVWTQAEVTFKKPMPTKVSSTSDPAFMFSCRTGSMHFVLVYWCYASFLLFMVSAFLPRSTSCHQQINPAVLFCSVGL